MRRDLIVSFLSSVPHEVLSEFKEQPATLSCPVQQTPSSGYPGGREGYRQWIAEHRGAGGVIPGLAREAGISSDDEIGRVAVMGFSNGCIGVDELLGEEDAFKLDTVLAFDGIHGVVGPGGAVRPSLYKRFDNFAAHVAQQNPELHPDAPVCVITHSSIGPIYTTGAEGKPVVQSPSTTTTADVIWQTVARVLPADYLSPDCGYGCGPALHLERMAQRYADPVEICVKGGCQRWLGLQDGWYDRRGANNFFVLGWGDVEGGAAHTKDPNGTADHIFQARVVLPAVLEEMVVRRWNRECFVVATAGLGQAMPGLPTTGCKLGQGVVYADSDAGVVDYFPDLGDDAPPASCPLPPPGGVLVGAPDNPCLIVGEQPPGATPSPPSGGVSGWSLFAGALGFASAYYLVGHWRR